MSMHTIKKKKKTYTKSKGGKLLSRDKGINSRKMIQMLKLSENDFKITLADMVKDIGKR